MELRTFIFATALAHIGFAMFVTVHASRTERDPGNWPYLTVAFGLAGLAGYFFYERDEEAAAM